MYAIASGLRGFSSSTLRVFITRREAGLVWVRTADLSDAGSPLVLDEAQVSSETAPTVVSRRDGLVTFEAL